MSRKSPTDFRVVQVELEVRINAPPQRVWDAIVNQTTHWWRKDFYTNPKTIGFHIEPRPGGRMYEDWGDGNGALWGIVQSIEPQRMISFEGSLTPKYGGPAHTMFQFQLEPADSGSIVKISDTMFGNLSEEAGAKMHEGWTLLFEQGLKEYVEQQRL